jgi:hypothetical protein
MGKYFYFVILSLMLNSCRTNSHNDVLIQSTFDTIIVGGRFSAELYIRSDTSIAPSFYIIKDNDTFRLALDQVKKCALFRAVEHESGEKNYNGYVEFINIKGIKERKDFSIKFFVR